MPCQTNGHDPCQLPCCKGIISVHHGASSASVRSWILWLSLLTLALFGLRMNAWPCLILRDGCHFQRLKWTEASDAWTGWWPRATTRRPKTNAPECEQAGANQPANQLSPAIRRVENHLQNQSISTAQSTSPSLNVHGGIFWLFELRLFHSLSHALENMRDTTEYSCNARLQRRLQSPL